MAKCIMSREDKAWAQSDAPDAIAMRQSLAVVGMPSYPALVATDDAALIERFHDDWRERLYAVAVAGPVIAEETDDAPPVEPKRRVDDRDVFGALSENPDAALTNLEVRARLGLEAGDAALVSSILSRGTSLGILGRRRGPTSKWAFWRRANVQSPRQLPPMAIPDAQILKMLSPSPRTLVSLTQIASRVSGPNVRRESLHSQLKALVQSGLIFERRLVGSKDRHYYRAALPATQQAA